MPSSAPMAMCGVDGGDGGHAGEIGGLDRLLEEIEAAAFDRAHIGDGLIGAEALVGVGRNQQAGAEHLADRARAGGVFFGGIDADLDLVGGEAGRLLLLRVAQVAVEIAAADDGEQRQAAAFFLAEQRMHRLAGGAAGEIEQRDLDRRLGAVIAVHAAVHGGERAFDVGRIAAAQGGCEIMHAGDQALERVAGHHRRGGGFAPADQAVVGFDAHQHVVGAAHFLARHDDGLEHRQADRDRLDGS